MTDFPSLLSYGVYAPLDPTIVASMDDERRALYDAAVESHARLDAADAALVDAQATVKELEQEASDLDRIRKIVPRPTHLDLCREARRQ